MSLKRRNSLLRRIYVSNIEIKHTNNKALITLYVINTQKKTLSKRYDKSKKFFENLKFNIENLQEVFIKNQMLVLKDKYIENLINNRFLFQKSIVFKYQFEILKKIFEYCNIYFNKYINKNIFNKL